MIWLLLLLAQSFTDQNAIKRGEEIFAQSCSVGYCHGVAGAAGRGPRLRARKLDRGYVEKVTQDGIPDSAMPGWKGRLSEAEIKAVVDYVMNLSIATDLAPPDNPMPPGVGPATIAEFPGPPEARQGHDLFFDATRGVRCATCHSLGARGIAVGPDLLPLASRSTPELLAMVRGTRSRHVITAKLRNGEVFPALRVEQNEKLVKLYDLSTTPPVLRTLERSEISSLVEGSDWRHESVVRNYSDQELQDLIPYLRWLSSSAK